MVLVLIISGSEDRLTVRGKLQGSSHLLPNEVIHLLLEKSAFATVWGNSGWHFYSKQFKGNHLQSFPCIPATILHFRHRANMWPLGRCSPLSSFRRLLLKTMIYQSVPFNWRRHQFSTELLLNRLQDGPHKGQWTCCSRRSSGKSV